MATEIVGLGRFRATQHDYTADELAPCPRQRRRFIGSTIQHTPVAGAERIISVALEQRIQVRTPKTLWPWPPSDTRTNARLD